MSRTRRQSGFTILEVLLASFFLLLILTGAFFVFGALTDKANLLIAEADVRTRVRYIEAVLRKDLERAKATSELEFYHELDGVLGPRFISEPFADYGTDLIPDAAEPLFNSPGWIFPGDCNTLYPDPACDDFFNYTCNHCGTRDLLNHPENYGEGNGIFNLGEAYFDIDGNGRYNGEPYLDNAKDQTGAYRPAWDMDSTQGNGDRNYRWDSSNQLIAGSNVYPHETWPTHDMERFGIVKPFDIDGDGAFSPCDEYLPVPRQFRMDVDPPEDIPMTMLADEAMHAIDGSGWIQRTIQARAFPNPTLAFEYITANLKPLSPFGFLDVDYNSATATSTTTNNALDPNEVPLYDYFGGFVNCGDQDSLYFRTRVESGGEMVEANVYYRIVFNNQNHNYSESYQDSNSNGIWEPGEPWTDANGNGICDPIVDPGERRLQRILLFQGNLQPIFQDLGPALRFNVESWNAAKNQFDAPFSDTGIDGLFDSEEDPNFSVACGSCPDPHGDNEIKGINEGLNFTEGNGKIDLANVLGLPAGNLNRNPFLPPSPSGIPDNPGENPFEGIRRFGYPDSAGALVLNSCGNLYPLNARDAIPVLGNLETIVLEPISYRLQWTPDNAVFPNGISTLGVPLDTLFPVLVRLCKTPGGATCSNCPNNPSAERIWKSINSGPALNQLFRFAPGGSFDENGWLRCAGVDDNLANLRPGDSIFVWAFRIPQPSGHFAVGRSNTEVPVPPGYYTIAEKRGNRLRLDLSKVPGGAPTREQLQDVPAIYRAAYLPAAIRIEFALEGDTSTFARRELRTWTLNGSGYSDAGVRSQGVAANIPVRGTVLTIVPGSER